MIWLSRRKDILGIQFGRLTAIQLDIEKSTKERSYWLCKCSCGNPNIKSIYLYQLTSGKTKSCGCLQNEPRYKKPKKQHQKTKKSRLYSIWDGMKQRCHNENNKRFADYGGRGIEVCSEWIDDFNTFEKWSLDNGYSENLTIDRMDNDGDYKPNNCRWATPKEQSRNMRNNKIIKYQGKEYCFIELLEQFGLQDDYSTIATRIDKLNWSVEEAINIPIGVSKQEYYFIKAIETEFKDQSVEYAIKKMDFKNKYNISHNSFTHFISKENVKYILKENSIINETYQLIVQ